MSETERAQLRRQMLSARRELSAARVTRAGESLAKRIAELPVYRQAQRLAGYLAMPGEMDTASCLRRAIEQGKRCYVPILAGKRLRFAPWSAAAPMRRNRFGIAEPDVAESELIDPATLDLVLVPLVAFDADCNRLGMGGGYYDRTFEAHRSGAGKPILIGVAHQLQKVEHLEAQWWDVPLDAVATDEHLYPRP